MDAQALAVEGRPQRRQYDGKARRRVSRGQLVDEALEPAELAPGRGLDLLPGQQGDHVVSVARQGVDVGHDPPVAQHQDPVRQPEHLVDIVRNQQYGRALFVESRNELFDLARLVHAEGKGGFVEDEQPGLVQHRLGHGEELAHTA